MKKNNNRKIWVGIGVAVAIVLLLWWLYSAILIDEDINEMTQNLVQQVRLWA